MRKNRIKIIILVMIIVLSTSNCSKNGEQTVPVNSNNNPTKVTTRSVMGDIQLNKGELWEKPLVGESDGFTPVVIEDTSSLSTVKIGWSWKYSAKDNGDLLEKYHGYAFGDTSNKYIYLTFDNGYENGYTGRILDTLKANNVRAAFFITEPYIKASYNGVENINLLKRMVQEGHIIGSHSVHHKSMPSITDEETFKKEIIGVEEALSGIEGVRVSKYFRPPMGEFSELSLYYTQKLGYRSIFYSLAYLDYDVDNQPDPEESKNFLIENTKPGMICLLHATSESNATILDDLIKQWKKEGYRFKTLDQLP